MQMRMQSITESTFCVKFVIDSLPDPKATDNYSISISLDALQADAEYLEDNGFLG